MSRGRTMTEAEYAALPGLRASWVKTLLSATPAHLRARMDSEDADTDALRIGRAVHCMILRPNDFPAEFAVSPRFDRRTKDGKAAAEAFDREARGRCVLDESELANVAAISSAVRANQSARMLLELCDQFERVYTGEVAGVESKCRIDALSETEGVLLDVKTTISASPRAFARAVVDFGYLSQMAFYRAVLRCHGIDVRNVVLVAVEKARPFAVALYEIDAADLDAVVPDVERAAETFGICHRTGIWPGYAQEIRRLAMPAWAFNRGTDNE